jgi:hypothetical protein
MAGQVWATNTLGRYMYSDNLSKVLRMAVQPLHRIGDHRTAGNSRR